MASRKAPLPAKDDLEDLVDDDKGESTGLETYPLDTLLIRSEPRAIADVLRRIEKNAIKLDPDFERDFVWDDVRQSRLIESVLMRIPLPVFYLAEHKSGLIVVDGLQRLTTFKRFKDGALKLKVGQHKELDGKKFNELPLKLQDRFEDGPLMFYLIDASVPDRVRLDIFERVNSGVPLSRQQMRNALYNGPATRLLRELAQSHEFLSATGGSLSNDKRKKSMSDREAANRFVAYFVNGYQKYGTGSGQLGDFDDFLASSLRTLNDHIESIADTRTAFVNSMIVNRNIFGKLAFRKHTSPNQNRQALNLALFDVFSVALAKYSLKSMTTAQQAQIRKGFYSLLKRPEFMSAISFATARSDNVHARFKMAEAMIRKVLGDP